MNKPTQLSSPFGEEADRKLESANSPAPPSLLERADNSFDFSKLTGPKPIDLTKAPPPKMPPAPVEPQREASVKQSVPTEAVDEPVSDRRSRPERGNTAARFTGTAERVSREHLRSLGLLDPDLGSDALVEEFRIVKRQVLAAAEAEGTATARRVLLSSPHPGEGKTFCATNLAIALAGERDIEVVLVDADFGKPSIMKNFGLEPRKGFMDVLRDPAAMVETYVVTTDIPGLHLLPAGERSGSDAEYLASERTWEVLSRLSRGAPNRFLIFDSPPALAASPAAELAKHVGQILLVARADRTAKAALEDAIDLLSACDDIRLLLNDTTFNATGRTFGRYYGYGG